MTHFAIARGTPENIVDTFRPDVDRETAQGIVDALSKWTGPVGKSTTKHFLVDVK